MSARNPQVIDSEEFIDILDYQFTGNEYTVERKRAFIEAYRDHGSVFHAANASRVSRKTVYNWINSDQQFAEAFEESKEDCYDQVESSVFQKAVKGDTLSSIFYLKAHRPKFRDRLTIDVEQVQDEINNRMQQLGLQQLPPAVSEFIPANQESQAVELESLSESSSRSIPES